MRQRIVTVVGTRPEAIKMAPVILRLRERNESFETVVCVTAQHREMLDTALALFSIRPDIDLDLMRPRQTPSAIAAGVLRRFDRVLRETAPEWLLVQGDTTTVMAASLAAFHRGIRVGHVEAGLRTGDLEHPFPEELNRRVADLVSTALFAPTERAAGALRREGIADERIVVTGNTIVDALQLVAPELPATPEDGRLVLITCHRRESFGKPMRSIFKAIGRLARRFPHLQFVFPVHPNPHVKSAIAVLTGIDNLRLTPPVDYRQLLSWMRAAVLVLTDSGGIQEEAPAFAKPTLVLREKTERPEGIEAGIARLVGTDEERIFVEASRLLSDPRAHAAMTCRANPYGDGHAAERIVDFLAGRKVEPFVVGTTVANAGSSPGS